MPEIERLSTEKLKHLEGLLTEQGAPVVKRFQPSASSEELAAVESYLGLPLPDELRLWWKWHNGTDVEEHERAVQCSIGPTFIVLSTAEAVESSRRLRMGAEKDAPEDPDSFWASHWIAIGTDGRVACNVAIDSDAAVPVLDVDYHKAAYPGAVVARSLGEMVRWWIEALESGAWRYDPDHNWWDRHGELVLPERESTGLV